MVLLIVILFCFRFFSFILFQNSMCICMCVSVCVCVAVNSHASYIWIVNDMTDSNTCLFSAAVFHFLFSLLFCFGIICIRRCLCLSVWGRGVRVAVNSHACYIWIVNYIID